MVKPTYKVADTTLSGNDNFGKQQPKVSQHECVMVNQYLAFVDRLGEVTGQAALCEAVKKGFKVYICNTGFPES